MKFTALISIISLLVCANAQATSTCQDAAVFNLCIKTQQSNLNSCGPVDYSCLCLWQRAILTCYNNCNDAASASQASIQQGVVSSICGAASLAVSQVTSAAPTSLSVSASNTMAPGPSNSIHPLTSPGASASGGGGGNGNSSGPTNSKPAPSVSPSGNVMSEGTHILSGASAVVFLISTVLYFIL